MSANPCDEELLRYRQEHFKVETEYQRGEIALRATTNGYQWWSFTFLPEEIPVVIAALQRALCPATTPTTTPLGTVQCSREAGHDASARDRGAPEGDVEMKFYGSVVHHVASQYGWNRILFCCGCQWMYAFAGPREVVELRPCVRHKR